MLLYIAGYFTLRMLREMTVPTSLEENHETNKNYLHHGSEYQ